MSYTMEWHISRAISWSIPLQSPPSRLAKQASLDITREWHAWCDQPWLHHDPGSQSHLVAFIGNESIGQVGHSGKTKLIVIRRIRRIRRTFTTRLSVAIHARRCYTHVALERPNSSLDFVSEMRFTSTETIGMVHHQASLMNALHFPLAQNKWFFIFSLFKFLSQKDITKF